MDQNWQGNGPGVLNWHYALSNRTASSEVESDFSVNASLVRAFDVGPFAISGNPVMKGIREIGDL